MYESPLGHNPEANIRDKNALPAAKWAGGVVTGAVAKAGLAKVYNAVKTWWRGDTSAAGDDVVMTWNEQKMPPQTPLK